MASTSKPQSEWTDDEWAQRGYVLITLRERFGVEDRIYIKRKFKSDVITPHEREMLIREAKKRHKENMRRRAMDYAKQRGLNIKAMAPYTRYAQQVQEQKRKEYNKTHTIPFDQLTFFDLID